MHLWYVILLIYVHVCGTVFQLSSKRMVSAKQEYTAIYRNSLKGLIMFGISSASVVTSHRVGAYDSMAQN